MQAIKLTTLQKKLTFIIQLAANGRGLCILIFLQCRYLHTFMNHQRNYFILKIYLYNYWFKKKIRYNQPYVESFNMFKFILFLLWYSQVVHNSGVFFSRLISIAVRSNFHLKFHFKLIFKHDYAQPSPSLMLCKYIILILILALICCPLLGFFFFFGN